MRRTLAAAIACTFPLMITHGLIAQPAPAPGAGAADVAATLRGRDALGDQDKAQLRQWVDARVQELTAASVRVEQATRAGDDVARGAALKALQTARKNLSDAAGQGATPAFRTAFADAAAAVFPPYLGTSANARGDSRVALHLIQILGSLRQTGSLDTLLVALNSRYPAVRYWAARAIRDMRADLTGRQPNPIDRVLAELARAGAKEGNPTAAEMMYQAVDVRSQVPGAGPKVVAAWLDMLTGRLRFYNSDPAVVLEDKCTPALISEFYPDANVLGLLQASSDLTDADKKRAIHVAYSIVEQCVLRWAAVARQDESTPVEPENPYDPCTVRDWHLRYQLARVTQEAETLLKKLVPAWTAGNQDVASQMMSLATADQVHTAFEKWHAIVQPVPTTAPSARR